MLAALQPAREKLEAVLVPMQDARNDTEESRSSQEQSFAAVLLSAVGGRRRRRGALLDGSACHSLLHCCVQSFLLGKSRQKALTLHRRPVPPTDGHKALISLGASP